ncbi:hypothetical protein XCR_0218 [Xanthomonas campestris pv. raphani 756C]|nr:hypothetical protein XCR_0218 [Xanthomonas campestris pv. raphani 756C]
MRATCGRIEPPIFAGTGPAAMGRKSQRVHQACGWACFISCSAA